MRRALSYGAGAAVSFFTIPTQMLIYCSKSVVLGKIVFQFLTKQGSLALEDMAGGSFTISNGGVFGSLMGTPIINPPQSAILGMHATKMRAVVSPDVSTCVLFV